MAITPFSHTPSPQSLFGVGAAATIGDKTLFKRKQRLLVMSDAGVAAAGKLAVVVEGLGARVVHTDTGAIPDGDTRHVESLAEQARALDIDGIVAVGGGSVIDSAKGVVGVLGTGLALKDLDGVARVRPQMKDKAVPLLAVPTTAGTGAEATQFCVIKDVVAGEKRIVVDQTLVPTLAVLDPFLLVGLPAPIAAATAVDAMTHAIEAIGSRMQNPIATALGTEALRRLLVDDALGRSLAVPDDVEARADCLIAAHLAGGAITSAMLGATHALAHIVGARCGLPHGLANGLFVVDVMRANLPTAGPAYTRAAQALGMADAVALIAAVERFVFETAGLPTSMRAALASRGVEGLDGVEARLTDFAAEAVRDPDMPTNPVRLDEAALLQILRARW